MQIDCYGFDATSVFFQRRRLQPHRIVESGDVTYICYDDGDSRPIHRITKNGSETVVEWAYGSWNERESLNYIPINKTREV